jgi:hypothetical protein
VGIISKSILGLNICSYLILSLDEDQSEYQSGYDNMWGLVMKAVPKLDESDRYTLDNAHFTCFNTIWPLSLSSNFGTAFITRPHILSYPLWYSLWSSSRLNIK